MTAHDAHGDLVTHDALERRPGRLARRCAPSRHPSAVIHVQERLEEASQPRRPLAEALNDVRDRSGGNLLRRRCTKKLIREAVARRGQGPWALVSKRRVPEGKGRSMAGVPRAYILAGDHPFGTTTT